MIWPEPFNISEFSDKRGITYGFDMPIESSKRAFIVKNDWYVARGFHRQLEMNRLVMVIEGSIIDVLRNDQGETREYHLNAGDVLVVPWELYHGYYTERPSTVLYVTDKYYLKEDEQNIADPDYFFHLANKYQTATIIKPKMSIRDMGGKTDYAI